MKELKFSFQENNSDNIISETIDKSLEITARKFLNKEVSIKPLFSIPLLHIKVSDWECKKQKLLEIFEENSNNLYARGNLLTTYHMREDFGDNIEDSDLCLKQIRELRKKVSNILTDELITIHQIFGNHLSACEQNTSIISQAWFQEQKVGMFHPPHSHGCHSLSSVCFINYNQEYHTPTHFISPHIDPLEGYNMEYIEKDVSEGSLLVFPSNIIHYTMPHNSDQSRIILSMNIDA